MNDKIKELVSGENRNIREKLFLIVCLECIVGAVICLCESVTIRAGIPNYLVIGSTLVIVPLAVRSMVYYGRQELPIIMVTGWMNLVVFPLVFFTCGGVNSGSNCWFALGFLFITLVYRGKPLVVAAILTSAVDVACYVTAYYHEELVRPLESKAGIYMDSAFGIVSIAITSALIFSYRRQGYGKESAVAIMQRNEIDRMAKSRERFYANFSHEIRNPINAIVGLNELNLRAAEDKEVVRNSEAIGRSGRLLLSLVNDIMDLSQIENSSMALAVAPYELADVLSELMDLVSTRAANKNLELSLEVDPALPKVLIGDERRVVQILLNILTNAVKYTEKGSVKLTVSGERNGLDMIRIKASVADTGIGIEKENLKHLFETYSQFDRLSNNSIEGNGLGLPIAYELTKLMNGDITVDSVYGKGSVFTIEFDQGYEEGALLGVSDYDGVMDKAIHREGYVRSFEAAGAKILVVDDDEQNRSIIRGLLRDTKVNVFEAGSGEEALMCTATEEYHIILVDYLMPGMSGIELLDAIRTQAGGKCRNSVIIALTGANLDSREHINARYSFDLILNKPVEYTVLEDAIADSLPPELIDYRNERKVDHKKWDMIKAAQKIKRKIRITTECAADLPKVAIEEYDIGIMPMFIRSEKGRFMDSVEISLSDTMGHLTETHKSVEADGATVEEYEAFFKKELESADEIVHVTFNGRFGLCYKRACEAAKSFSHVKVIDSGLVSSGVGLMAVIASRWAADGATAEEIERDMAKIRPHVEYAYILPSAEILAQRGKMSARRAAIYDALQIHPVIHQTNRGNRQIRAHRGTMEQAIRKHIKTTMAIGGRMDTHVPIIVNHMGIAPRVQGRILTEMRKNIPETSIMIAQASVTSASFSGLGAMGIAYLRANHLDVIESERKNSYLL